MSVALALGFVAGAIGAVLTVLAEHSRIAFGSYARGDMHELSDLDLILVGDFTLPPKARMRQIMAART